MAFGLYIIQRQFLKTKTLFVPFSKTTRETPPRESIMDYSLFTCETIFAPGAAVPVARAVRGRFKTGEIPFGRLDCANKLGFAHGARMYAKFFRFFFQVGNVQHGSLLLLHILI
jgi:hypothetical protein